MSKITHESQPGFEFQTAWELVLKAQAIVPKY